MNLLEVSTDERIKAEILRLEDTDNKSVFTQFGFDWRRERVHTIYGLRIISSEQIVGLISISDFAEEYRIHINLLELLKDNVGANKRYRNIAGCLIAYCCQLSFEKGYDGFVSLIPKTQLVKHYREAYGFELFGRQLAIHSTAAERLVQEYLQDT